MAHAAELIERDAAPDRERAPRRHVAARHRMDRFPAFGTGLTRAHAQVVEAIRRDLTARRNGPAPVRAVTFVGHSSTWRNVKTEDYAYRAMARAYAAAGAVKRALEAGGLRVTISGERLLDKPVKDADVALFVGSRANREPLVDNLVHRTDRTARANRARNRRVEVTLYAVRSKRKGKTANVLVTESYKERLRPFVGRAAKATFDAERRMARLANMPEAERRKAWNGGAEKLWFGDYDGAGKTASFALVKRFVDRASTIFQGKRTPGKTLRQDRRHVLKVEAYPGARPKPSKCRTLRSKPHPFNLPPVERWIDAAREQSDRVEAKKPVWKRKLEREDRATDLLYIRCKYQTDLGVAFRTRDVSMSDPRRNPIERAPYKIALCPGWFRAPRGQAAKRRWARKRDRTIVHEVAHLAGVSKLEINPQTGDWDDAEVYGDGAIKRLARRKPRLARLNAENYAAYIMGFAPKA